MGFLLGIGSVLVCTESGIQQADKVCQTSLGKVFFLCFPASQTEHTVAYLVPQSVYMLLGLNLVLGCSR